MRAARHRLHSNAPASDANTMHDYDLSLPHTILSPLSRCSLRYRLDLLTGPIGTALSGGKDSLCLAIALRAIGAAVTAIVVDLGYSRFDSRAVQHEAERWGIPTVIADAWLLAAPSPATDMHECYSSRIRESLTRLADPLLPSPCTLCSATKRQTLATVATQLGISRIAFGHHREDFLATLLKDYFVEAYFRDFDVYSPESFEAFVSAAPVDLPALQTLVRQRKAATMGVRVSPPGFEIIRPLAFVAESSIEDFSLRVGLRVAPSGCTHSSFADDSESTPTKREIVHRDLRTRLTNDPTLANTLLPIALGCLNRQGYARFNPRRSREQRLPGYSG